MGLLKQRQTQTTTGTWSASTTISTLLDRDGVITRIYATVEVTPSATLTGANQPDGLFRVLRGLRIVGGGHTFFDTPVEAGGQGGTLLHYLNLLDGFGLGHPAGGITAPMRLFTPITFALHCGARVRKPSGKDNPYDLSAFIPASALASLSAEWSTSANSLMDDVVTISSATIRYTHCQILANELELLEEMGRQKVVLPPGVKAMMPDWSTEVYAHTADFADYSSEHNVPTGGWLKRIALLAQDATTTRPLRAADEIAGISLKLKRDGTHVYKARTEHLLSDFPVASNLEADDGAADFQMNAPVGIYHIDGREPTNGEVQSDYGLDMNALGVGDLILGLTVENYASGDDTLILYEKFKQVLLGQAIA